MNLLNMSPLRISQEHEFNVSSQSGEDGIVETIFQTIGLTRGTAVEVGAWDGIYLSNTAQLRDKGWRVCLIEGDLKRFQSLSRQFSNRPDVTCLNAWVRPEGEGSLDRLLGDANFTEVDFLSIDIDGDDYHIFKFLSLRPKVICIEFNPSIPPPIAIVGNLGAMQGSSLAALDSLARSKDYALVYATRLNAFFVRDDIADRFVTISPIDAYPPENARVLISEYNGHNRLVDFNGNDHRPWNPWSQQPAAILINVVIRPWLRRAIPSSILRLIRRDRRAP